MSSEIKVSAGVQVSEKDDHISVNSIRTSSSGHSAVKFDEVEVSFKKKLKLFFTFKSPRSAQLKRKAFFWNPPGQSKYERKLVFKLDCIILSYVCISFFIRYLDQSNISNAYVSGMQEDLKLHGTMYNWLNSSFYIAYSIFGLPLTVFATRIKPHILLPALEVLWGIMCLLVITCHSYKTLMVVRVIQGALEGGCFPILHYILGSWYTKNELSSRTALYIASGSIGTMFGGYIQSGVYKHLNNKGGLPGWRWIFVIDFIITIPCAIYGYLIIPDVPLQPRPSRFLSREDIEYCANRVRVVQKVEEADKFDFKVVRKMLTSWQFYIFNIYYTVCHLPDIAGSYWAIVLKSEGYNVYQRNNYPTIQSGVNVIACVLAGIYVDIRGTYWDGVTILHIIWIIGLALLVKWDIPRAAQFVAYAFCGMSGAVSTLCCSWANELTRDDVQLRAAVLGSLNLINIGPSTALTMKLFNTDFAPKYTTGTRVALGILCVSFCHGFLILLFDRYQNRKRDYIEDFVNEKFQNLQNLEIENIKQSNRI